MAATYDHRTWAPTEVPYLLPAPANCPISCHRWPASMCHIAAAIRPTVARHAASRGVAFLGRIPSMCEVGARLFVRCCGGVRSCGGCSFGGGDVFVHRC